MKAQVVRIRFQAGHRTEMGLDKLNYVNGVWLAEAWTTWLKLDLLKANLMTPVCISQYMQSSCDALQRVKSVYAWKNSPADMKLPLY